MFSTVVFAFLSALYVRGLDDALRLVREHEVALSLLDDPGCSGEVVGVGRVIGVVVRQDQVRMSDGL